MKSTMTVVVLTAFAVSAGAQSASTQGMVNATGSAEAAAGQTSAAAVQAAQVSAVLSKSIDSKNAKVGEEVSAKTTAEAKLANGTRIPKGSRLVGHVTEVEPKSHDNRNGRVAFSFDHAVLRDGQQIPVHVLMRSIAAPAPIQAGPGASDDMMAGAGAMSQGAPTRGGGGVVGGATAATGGANGVLRGTTGMAADSSSQIGTNAQEGLDAAERTMSNGSGSAGRDTAGLAATAGASGNFSGPVANLSGVMFTTVHASGDASQSGASGSASASTATMLVARGGNVSLASGSQMMMMVSAQ